MSGISFSGIASGLDTASIVSQLVELKRQPIYRLEKDKSGYQAQIASLGTLKTKLLALQKAAQAIDTAGEFASLKATSSNEDILTVTAGTEAAAGSYDITVKTLAKAQKEISQGYSTDVADVGSGTISFTVGEETTELTLVGYNSLESVKNLINDSVEGVSASIVNDGLGGDSYHLVLSSAEAGSAGAFSMDLSGLSGGTAPTFTTQQAAEDATLTIDGIDVIATSNNAEDVISGLTLNLEDFDPATQVTIQVEVDSEGIAGKVKAMVDAYNDLFAFVEKESGTTGSLRTNPTLRTVASRLENLFTSSLEGGLGNITNFFQVGITRGTGRQLEWDEDKFAETIEANFSGVRDLFIERDGNLGKMYLLDNSVDDMTDSIDGLFKISTDALNKRIDYADQSIERYERSVESYRVTMERKFTAMEAMVSQLQAQGNYLSSAMYY